MALFTSAVYQNEFLPDGGTDVNAIVTVACSGVRSGSGERPSISSHFPRRSPRVPFQISGARGRGSDALDTARASSVTEP